MPREWNTPVREPWNRLIKETLEAIDRHEALYRSSGEGWHVRSAHALRQYLRELKDWIIREER